MNTWAWPARPQLCILTACAHSPHSYCNLDTTFSVYVYGALPVAMFPPVLSISLLVSTTLLSVWLAYIVPIKLQTEQGQRFKAFCSQLCSRCLCVCTCGWLHLRLQQWLRRKMQQWLRRRMQWWVQCKLQGWLRSGKVKQQRKS